MASESVESQPLPPAVLLMGPTAAGKTAAAMHLHERFPVRLISVDSAQVYRGLDIGSAKLDPATLARYPHELVDLRDPESTYSAAHFVADAEAAMRRAAADERLPVLVGGTVLYFRALLFGLDPLPAADPALRAAIADRARHMGWAALHEELRHRDPATAARLKPSDSQRIQRALEVLELTGRGLNEHHRHVRLPRFPTLRLVLSPADRGALHRRIASRVDEMLAAGLVAEVEGLRQRPVLSAAHASMKSVGYRQVWAALDGDLPEGELSRRINAATRQLAKRQLTGLRKFSGALWYDSTALRTIDTVLRRVGGFCRPDGGGLVWPAVRADGGKTLQGAVNP